MSGFITQPHYAQNTRTRARTHAHTHTCARACVSPPDTSYQCLLPSDTIASLSTLSKYSTSVHSECRSTSLCNEILSLHCQYCLVKNHPEFVFLIQHVAELIRKLRALPPPMDSNFFNFMQFRGNLSLVHT